MGVQFSSKHERVNKIAQGKNGPPVDEGKESAPNDTTITKYFNSAKGCISPSYSHSDLKSDGILVSGKCDYASSSSSNSFLVEGSKQ